VRWLTRVPERIGLARARIQEMRPAGQKGYRYLELGTTYGGVRQRWRIVWSEQAERRERATLQKRVSQEREEAEQAWKSWMRHEFPSREAVERWTGKWAYHQAEVRYRPVTHYSQRGRPGPGAVPQRVGWRLEGKVVERCEAIAQAERGLGKFILATHERNEERLPAEEMLLAYKGQGIGLERGFRFLKDPWFFADSWFLKSPKRIMALVLVMGLALLVYALAEHQLRATLQERGGGERTQPGRKAHPASDDALHLSDVRRD
jgi:transposase